GSSPLAPRARIEKSLSRSAASRFDSVCSGRTTRCRTLNEQPVHTPTMNTVRVHWTLGVESPVHRKMSATTAAGKPAASASSRMRWSKRRYDPGRLEVGSSAEKVSSANLEFGIRNLEFVPDSCTHSKFQILNS